jgi:uncharacterized protein (DUF2267 family)
MREDEIISAVRESTSLPSKVDAERAVAATLSVLGERITAGERTDLAAQLPGGLAEALPPSSGTEARRFALDEFYREVAAREGDGCTEQQARQHARAVMAALRSGLTPGEFDDVAAQLPPEYDDLLGTGGPLHH